MVKQSSLGRSGHGLRAYQARKRGNARTMMDAPPQCVKHHINVQTLNDRRTNCYDVRKKVETSLLFDVNYEPRRGFEL
jgi:hypothetical protein